MDGQGRLIEDWGSITVNVAGAGLPASAPATLQSIKLDGIIPAAQAQSQVWHRSRSRSPRFVLQYGRRDSMS